MPLVALLFLSFCLRSSFAVDRTFSRPWMDYHLRRGCTIHELSGEVIKAFPGSMCQFLDDGSYLSASDRALRYFSKTNELRWEVPGEFHHQLNLSHDKSRILALASNYLDPAKTQRRDRILVIDFNGKILFETGSEALLLAARAEPFSPEELTHLNSFYEIPPRRPGSTGSTFTPGSFIVNSKFLGLWVLSPDLKRILYHARLKGSRNHAVHDVQVLENGNLFLFNNDAGTASTRPYSAVQELRPDGSVVREISASPKELFYSHQCGGAQKLDEDHVLFSHMFTGTYFYSIPERRVLKSTIQTHYQNRVFFTVQDVKLEDLRSFLQHWK